MKILLCYSKDHFDPSIPRDKNPNWGGSANILARELYAALGKFGDVTYSDGFDYEKHAGEKYDLFVGPDRNFCKIIEVCDIKKSILIAVNMHPKERNRILTRFAEEELHDRGAIADGDLVDEEMACLAIEKADFIFCVGNNTTYNSYIKNDVPRYKIKTFNYGLLDRLPTTQKPKNKTRLLYSASRIGLRKGFDIVESIATALKAEDFHLDIVGLPTSDYYSDKVHRLVEKFDGKVTYHGFVPAKSKKYHQIFESNDFLIFPSLEEGQAGTVIEAMYFGLIPLITAESGIDFSPLGFLEAKTRSQSNESILLEALALKISNVLRLKNKTQEYYREFHQGFAEALEESFKNCLETSYLYPKLSLVLPIYNKESTIKELLVLLDKAATEYRNIETHIIFDGCSDKSEKRVRKFYKNQKKYNINFYNTPNIFEVKSNNLGLKKSSGKYVAIIQDDIYVYDRYCFFEAVQFLDKDSRAAVVGGLAGVNFYPLGTKGLKGRGQIIASDYEVYWRQDESSNPDLKHRIFEVDACMRGPLFIRKRFLEEHGYLDETYAPLYQDDMDICFRARNYDYKVYCILMNVANKSQTMAHYNPEKAKRFAVIMKRNSLKFYSRWMPSTNKDYMWVNRIPVWSSPQTNFLRSINVFQ